MKGFGKRRYQSFGQFFGDVKTLWRQRKDVVGIMRGKALSADFRERLMLAVTAVNQCRYCTFVHTRAALKEGVSKDEVDGLFEGTLTGIPERERTAVLYAHHWAEAKGQPDPEAVERLTTEYGPETSARIEATLRFINLCNLSGNTTDWVLHTLSFGALGGQ